MREYATAPEEPVIQDSRITELQKAISQAINSLSAEKGSGTPDFILAEFLTDCLMAWNKATRKRSDWYSPEEPATEDSSVVQPVPEWRELGQDEVICEGDEYAAIHMGWRAVGEYFLSRPAYAFKPTPFRTRRPLPKKEEERPLEKDQVIDYCRKWAAEHLAGHGTETFYARLGLLVDFATDLYRDEIQKLKEAK